MLATLKKRPPETTTPERAALATRIVAVAEAAQRRVALHAAHEAATEAVYEGRRAVEAAEAGIVQAKAAAIEHAVSVASGASGTPPLSVRESTAVLAECQESLTAALAARDQLPAGSREGEAATSISRMDTASSQSMRRSRRRWRPPQAGRFGGRLRRRWNGKGNASTAC